MQLGDIPIEDIPIDANNTFGVPSSMSTKNIGAISFKQY